MLPEGTLSPAKSPWVSSSSSSSSAYIRRKLGPAGYGNLRGGGLESDDYEPHLHPHPAYLLGHGWLSEPCFGEGQGLLFSPLINSVMSEDKLSLFLLVILGPPAVSCSWLSMQPTFTYWFGQSSVILTAAALLCVATGQAALIRGSLPRRLVLIVSVFVPVACLLLTATFTGGAVGGMAFRLQSLDCRNYAAKWHVEEAWRAAAQLKEACLANRTAATSEARQEEVELTMPVQECPGYEEGFAQWGYEWEYLKALEETERCAGSLILLAAIAVASAKSFNVRSFEYGFCDGAAEPLTIDALSVLPDPLVLATGAEINLQVLLTLLEPLPVGAKIKVNMQKDGLINIPIPCINVGEISIGTCEYDGQELLDLAGEFLCPTYVPEGQACTLPLGPGQYGGQEPISIVLPELPSLIIDLLASGTYELKITALLADGSEMTCIQAKVDLTGH